MYGNFRTFVPAKSFPFWETFFNEQKKKFSILGNFQRFTASTICI